VSGGDHRWFKRSTVKKRPVTRDEDDDDDDDGDNNNNNNNNNNKNKNNNKCCLPYNSLLTFTLDETLNY